MVPQEGSWACSWALSLSLGTNNQNSICFSWLGIKPFVSFKKNPLMQLQLEGTMLSEISQRKTNTVCYHLYMESKK